ncbi:hypothetical protein Tco_0208451, partial [Tanacetum coccineum]
LLGGGDGIGNGGDAGNGGDGICGNGDDSHTSRTGARRPMQVARECTYPDFLKCQPLNFKGTEGVAGNAKAQAKVYAVGNAGANPDNNVVTAPELLSLQMH